jgi:hypothetical protein
MINKNHLFRRCPQSGRIIGFNPRAAIFRWLFPIFGLAALLWVVVRLLPKPSRIVYPCMKAAVPAASTFLVWFGGLNVSIVALRWSRAKRQRRKFLAAVLLIVVALTAFAGSLLLSPKENLRGQPVQAVEDPYGVNNPIGEPKGIFPGRVVWVWNPDATNENCVPNKWGDAYFLDKNCNQDVVDGMLANAILQLTGAPSEESAWDGIFHYFNQHHDKGDVGYTSGEKIFIKINAVHAWTTKNDGSILNDDSYGNVDTSPQAVLAMLRQLVNKAGVPQENIYIGDPYTHIFNHCLAKWRADFPNIHYMDKSGLAGREKYKASSEYAMHFSDHGSVLSVTEDKFFTVMEDADYLLDIPAMKGHRWGGVTFFGKNFFGTNTRSGADHMHPGLHRVDYDTPLRGEYGMYRVFVDLLGHKDLGGKILVYFMDALWSCSYEHEPPVKFQMAPFNNDWMSSIMLSLDPLAIESVCLDILQAEFPKEESEVPGKYWYANFPAVDDYLHQAADSKNWPEGIIYDPEGDGTPIGSLGVHEHWNNPTDQQYTRNLGTGEGIELVKLDASTAVERFAEAEQPASFSLLPNYPNPFNSSTVLTFELKSAAAVHLDVFSINGQKVATLVAGNIPAGTHRVIWDGWAMPSGLYFSCLAVEQNGVVKQTSRPMLLIR